MDADGEVSLEKRSNTKLHRGPSGAETDYGDNVDCAKTTFIAGYIVHGHVLNSINRLLSVKG